MSRLSLYLISTSRLHADACGNRVVQNMSVGPIVSGMCSIIICHVGAANRDRVIENRMSTHEWVHCICMAVSLASMLACMGPCSFGILMAHLEPV